MRNLTVKREKSFVASLMTMKVYIEDPTSSELMIGNVPCRKIGELQNGETQTFVIDDNAAKVFVIADKVSIEFCNDCYNIPAGTEDIYISGKNRFNPTIGNAFRFDGVRQSEDVLQNRKKSTRKGIIVLVVSILVGLALGAAIIYFVMPKTRAKTFSVDGMQITLTSQFTKIAMEGYTACYDSKNVAVFVIKEEFESQEDFEDYTLQEYGELLIDYNGFAPDVKLKNGQGLTYFEYEYNGESKDDSYHYFTVLYQGPDAFWMVQFATRINQFDNYRPTIIEWAKSVEFTNP